MDWISGMDRKPREPDPGACYQTCSRELLGEEPDLGRFEDSACHWSKPGTALFLKHPSILFNLSQHFLGILFCRLDIIGKEFHGIDFQGRICGVSIMRAGESSKFLFVNFIIDNEKERASAFADNLNTLIDSCIGFICVWMKKKKK